LGGGTGGRTEISPLAERENLLSTGGLTVDEPSLDIVKLLGAQTIADIIMHYAEATGVASGMVQWTSELADLARRDIRSLVADPEVVELYRRLRVTKVVNESPLCKAVRAVRSDPLGDLLGDLHCCHSDAWHCQEARQRGSPVVYHCHAGLVDFVCPVYVGSHHVANVYGGQLLLEAERSQRHVRQHEELRDYAATQDYRVDGGPCCCLRKIPDEELESLFGQVVRMKPLQVRRCLLLLQDIADLLSTRATEAAALDVLRKVEEQTSEILAPAEGLQMYLEAARNLVSFERAVVLFRHREAREMEPVATWQVGSTKARQLVDESILEAATTGERLDLAKAKVRAILVPRGPDFCELIPMRVADQSVGCWVVASAAPDPLPDRARALLQTFAARAATFAVSAWEVEILADVQHRIAAVATDPDKNQLPREVTQGAGRLYGGSEPAGLWVLNHEAKQFEHWELPGDPFNGTDPIPSLNTDGSPASLSGQAILSREVVWIDDIQKTPLHQLRQKAAEMALRGVLSIPLLAGGRAVGVLHIHQRSPTAPKPHQRALLEAYGRSVAQALQAWQLYWAGQELDACQHSDELGEQIRRQTRTLMGSSYNCVWRYLERSGRYVLEEDCGYDRGVMEAMPPRPEGTGVTEWLRRNRRPKAVWAVNRDNTRREILDHHPEIKAWVGLPLVAGGRFLGGLYLAFTTVRDADWEEGELLFLSRYADSVATALDRIVRTDQARCAEILATHSLWSIAASHVTGSYLAAIDDNVESLIFSNPQVAKDIRTCLTAIREEEARYAGFPVSEPTQSIDIKELVKQEWERVNQRTHSRYQPTYKNETEKPPWPIDALQWPQCALRQVLETVFENAVEAMNDAVLNKKSVRENEISIHIKVEQRGGNMWLYLWNSHPEFRENDVAPINAGERPPSAKRLGLGFRWARAVLLRSGGTLRVCNAPGALVTLRIPMNFQPAY